MQRAPISIAAPLATTMDDPAQHLEAAFRRYSRYVAAVALRLLGRDDEVDDVVQEVFLAALRGIERLREPEAVKGWLATVTVRIAARRLRRRRVRALFGVDRAADYDQIVAPGVSPDDRALLARIYRLLDEQPVKERLAWSLRYVEGEPLERVAELCRCSLATAKRRIAAVQARLQKELDDA